MEDVLVSVRISPDFHRFALHQGFVFAPVKAFLECSPVLTWIEDCGALDVEYTLMKPVKSRIHSRFKTVAAPNSTPLKKNGYTVIPFPWLAIAFAYPYDVQIKVTALKDCVAFAFHMLQRGG